MISSLRQVILASETRWQHSNDFNLKFHHWIIFFFWRKTKISFFLCYCATYNRRLFPVYTNALWLGEKYRKNSNAQCAHMTINSAIVVCHLIVNRLIHRLSDRNQSITLQSNSFPIVVFLLVVVVVWIFADFFCTHSKHLNWTSRLDCGRLALAPIKGLIVYFKAGAVYE